MNLKFASARGEKIGLRGDAWLEMTFDLPIDEPLVYDCVNYATAKVIDDTGGRYKTLVGYDKPINFRGGYHGEQSKHQIYSLVYTPRFDMDRAEEAKLLTTVELTAYIDNFIRRALEYVPTAKRAKDIEASLKALMPGEDSGRVSIRKWGEKWQVYVSMNSYDNGLKNKYSSRPYWAPADRFNRGASTSASEDRYLTEEEFQNITPQDLEPMVKKCAEDLEMNMAEVEIGYILKKKFEGTSMTYSYDKDKKTLEIRDYSTDKRVFIPCKTLDALLEIAESLDLESIKNLLVTPADKEKIVSAQERERIQSRLEAKERRLAKEALLENWEKLKKEVVDMAPKKEVKQ